ncbi:MAG TPA: pirin family protein [Kofleriaceae bacterium]|jgi:hypothetical protein
MSDVELVIDGRARDLGGFSVERVLPAPLHRMVGPFTFLDHMGPADVPADHPMTVRPHPHVCLATVTYLFEGEIVHRDSLGSHVTIAPGAINWMTAGRGIVHSERGPAVAQKIHGLQLWCALPTEHEETEPTFQHVPASDLPQLQIDGATVRVLAGEAFGKTAPTKTLSRLFYVDIDATSDATIELPDYPERAAYAVTGCFSVGGETYEHGHMTVFGTGPIRIEVQAGTRMVLLGGDPIGKRLMYWNFVASTQERIDRAKADWKAGRFPKVPGDEIEFIPLPEDAH